MNLPSIADRLAAGEALLLDGGTGSELQRRGADVLKGATNALEAWSATANIEYADVVQQVHQDYLRVGADIITSNNFWTIPSRLQGIGLADRWEEYARAGAQNAITAREAGNSASYIAAGMASPTLKGGGEDIPSDVEQMGEAAYHKEYSDHARLLAGMGVDLILAEYVGHIDDCVIAVDACAEAGVPVFLGVRHIREDGLTQYGDSLKERVAVLEGHPVDAILMMCCTPEAISAGLPILKDAFDGPVGGYPNLGYNPTGPLLNRDTLTNRHPSRGPDILQVGGYSPSRLAEFAEEWKGMGAQIIGGCCASGPEHIMAMRPVVKGNGPAEAVVPQS
jgi:S-methylmethionine-dependent homocysteine/selenocysteine methylase